MKHVLALSAICVLLTACDAGTEGSSSSSFPVISDFDLIDIASDNASSNVSSALGGVGGSVLENDTDLLEDQAAASSAIALAQSIASEYLQASTRADTQTGTGACTDGGTVSIEFQGEFSVAGDFAQAIYNDCEEDGVITDGGLRITIHESSIVGTDLSVVYQGLTVTESGVTSTLNGDFRMAALRSGTQQTGIFTSNSLSMESSVGGDTVIDDLSIVLVSDSATQIFTLELNYDIASDELGGRLNFETLRALSFSGTNDNPSTGILSLNGANESSVTLNADTGDLATVSLVVANAASVTSDIVNWASIGEDDLTGLIDLF